VFDLEDVILEFPLSVGHMIVVLVTLDCLTPRTDFNINIKHKYEIKHNLFLFVLYFHKYHRIEGSQNKCTCTDMRECGLLIIMLIILLVILNGQTPKLWIEYNK